MANAQAPADDTDVLCPPGYRLEIPKPDTATIQDKNMHVDADSATVDSQAVTRFTGSVVIRQSGKQLTADQVTYDNRSELLNAQGNIVFTTGEIQLKGDNAQLNLGTNTGEINDADYQTGTVNGRGKAKVIHLKSKTEVSMDQATYTTCPRDNVVWRLRADEINLNNENHQGTAKSTVLEVAHVPVLYLPYIRFPIGDDRMSGFLYPAISVSQSNGTELAIPYYWNIAPNMDATITPHNMSKRGLMLENEFRYLTPSGAGKFELEDNAREDLYRI